ncbi:putative D,D-dipeptide-binding periplasmic protein DdpA [Mycolicibacterium vanbaalenii]|uniref:Putative D,D-dipeptide-binding periplasmic protein DdpA n=1 Tax=Mycolicibacterium vanbaalenii TaxID=110539 RepID=A0A5S9R7J1_MYCVN|nr:ABC transporter substrate-binding protein [Mycolicibacterium vanbaalenii]CAA0131871.1 putative D,D-dipeptide-binding periplasmic protein DdpA [Mycolicibacterium vanbaalenii]
MTRTPINLDRRTFLKASGLTVGGLSLAHLVAACGGEASQDGQGNLTLRMPFLQDMQVPDPDIMYEGEGVQVMSACYEGLVNYKSGTSEIIPRLAESWTVSDDQLTYTFKLVPDVKFHDGTPADAAAWIKGLERRAAINEGPAYMVTGIAKSEAPDPTTLVVTLEEPNNAFLHYAACPWQPYAVSPTAVETHAVGDDLAQEWLKTHDAGTGPYVMKEFVPGSHYTLERFDDYWGEAPHFQSIRIEIVPEVATQKLQLDQGAFDLVSKGFAIADVLHYQQNPQFNTITAPGATVMVLWMNFSAGIFADKALRQAMMTALDRSSIVETAFQGLTEVQSDFWPENMFPAGMVPFDPAVDIAPLQAQVPTLSSTNVDLAWVTSYGAPAQQVAELIQTQLAPAGLNVTVRAMPSAESFDLANQPAERRPDLMVAGIGGDALHLDTVLRIFLRTGAKPLNYFQYGNLEVDRLMDEAITKPTDDEANEVYLQITDIIQDEALWIPLCRRMDNTVTKNQIDGFEGNSYVPYIFDPRVIRRA